MRIKKTSQSTTLPAQVVNTYNESQENAYSCDYVNKAFGGTILWTNQNPTNTFNNQDIQINATDYNKFDIICRLSTSNDIRICQTIYKGNTYRLMEVGYATNDNAFIRDVSITNTTISIGNCSGYGVGSNTTFTAQTNNALIPLQVMGYK